MPTPTLFNLPFDLKQKIFKSKKIIKLQDEYNECLEELYKIIHRNNMNVEEYFEKIIEENSVDNINYIDGKPEYCFFETFIVDCEKYDCEKSHLLPAIYFFIKNDIALYEKQLLSIIKQKLAIQEKDLTEINKLIEYRDEDDDEDDDNDEKFINNEHSVIKNSTILNNIFDDIMKRIQEKFKIYADMYEKYHKILHQYKDEDEIYLLRSVDNFVKCNFINKRDEDINKYLEEEKEYFDPTTYDTFVKDYNYFLKLKRNDIKKFDIVKIFLDRNTDELDKMKHHNFEKECGFDETVYPYFIKSIN